jgi:hypothetical protein
MEISFAGPAPQQQDQGGQRQQSQGNQQRGQGNGQQRQQPQQRSQGNQQRPAQRQAPANAGGASGFDDFDSDDIPFISADPSMDMVTSKSRRMKRYEF